MSDDLTARLRGASLPITLEMAMEGYVQDAHAVALHAEAADRIDSLTRERDELAATVERLADWVRQYERERDAARLSSASADLSLLASIRQSMFDEAEAVLADTEAEPYLGTVSGYQTEEAESDD